MLKPMFTPFPVLETKRLSLRDLRQEDALLIYTLKTSSEGRKYIDRPIPESVDDCLKEVKDKMLKIAADEFIIWVIESHIDKMSLGTICLWNFSKDKKTAEVGYELLAEEQKMGYMTEALKRVINYARQDLQMHKITAYTHQENEASNNLLRRNGFIQESQSEEQIIYLLNLKP